MFLEHFVKEVLPIINTEDTSQSYEFDLIVSDSLYSEFDVEEILAGIIAALPNSSDLSFDFDFHKPIEWQRVKRICLPVDRILN